MESFALHLIQKRTKSVKDKLIDSCLQMELRFLRHLSLPKYREREVLTPIVELNQGGLHMVTPDLLPFLQQLVEKMASRVNDDTRMELGQRLIKVAKGELENDLTVQNA